LTQSPLKFFAILCRIVHSFICCLVRTAFSLLGEGKFLYGSLTFTGMCPLSPLQIFSVRLSYPPFLNRQGESWAILPTHAARLVSDSGTKAAPLLGSGNRGLAKEMAALSLLNKVCNSIYSNGWSLSNLLLFRLQLQYLQAGGGVELVPALAGR
jgi:hypothetical protein